MTGDQRGQPLVSVVIPAYNSETTLAQTLSCVTDQTYPNLEILIVDDGSTDTTPAIAADFCRTEPRARMLRKPNGGVASARNLGIAQARGEWIAPLDADDLWHPTKIAKQVAAAIAAPVRPGFVYCWHQSIDDTGRVMGSGPRVAVNGNALRQLAFLNFVGNGSAPLISAEAMTRVGGYDASLRDRGGEGCEDQRIQLQIAQHFPIVAVPEDLVGYRSHEGSMSRKGRQMFRSWELLVDEWAREGVVPPQIRRWVLSGCNLWFADAMIAERSFGAALRGFATALRLDPGRASVLIAHRVIRLAVRVICGPRQPREGIPYGAPQDGEAIAFDAFEIRPMMSIVRALDRKRMRKLATLDAEARPDWS